MTWGAIIALVLMVIAAIAVAAIIRRGHGRAVAPSRDDADHAALLHPASADAPPIPVSAIRPAVLGERIDDAETGNVAHVSPDRRTWVMLKHPRPSVPGEHLYMLELLGVELTGRWFADGAVWSADSRYLALPELMPRTHPGLRLFRVIVIDTERQRHAIIDPPIDSGIVPERFDGMILVTRVIQTGDGVRTHPAHLRDWQPLRAHG